MNQVFEFFSKIGIIPVVVLDHADDAAPLAQALIDGGLPCAEVTFRTDAAAEAIEIMSRRFPELMVGAGTVLSVEQVDSAVQAGARFIVTPGLNPEVVKHCIHNNIPVCPGICTPTEIERALSLGIDIVKFFPAEPIGGISYLKAIAAPYTGVKFVPTGGINAENVRDYLGNARVLACGGSWMVKKELINAGNFTKIKEMAREAAEIVREIRG